MTKAFELDLPISEDDKTIVIIGPDGLLITIDYDDVDHTLIQAHAKRIERILNAIWYARL